MAIANSGAISLSTIQTEFGGANPISINEYYAGGTYVPSGTSGVNGAVPTSGQISFSQFYGTSDVVINLNADTYDDFGYVGINDATVEWQCHSNGSIVVYTTTTGSVAQYNWVVPTSFGSDYWVRVNRTSGSFFNTGGYSTNVWTDTVNSPAWGISRTTTGAESITFTAEIASDSSGTNILDTASITLNVEMSN